MSTETTPLRVGVIGCGRMGRLHARVYSQMPQVSLEGVFDLRPEKASDTSLEYGGSAFETPEALLEEVDAVTIASPTTSHLELAEMALDRRVACLIEKPLAPNVEQARQIRAMADEANVVVQVGHIERFNPVVRAARRLNIQPRFIDVSRISPMTFRSIDVGVVLDMMIHDIDIVLRLAQSEIERIDAVGVSVIGAVEDICNARIKFTNGCVADMTASRLAMKTDRKMRVFSPDAYVSLDYQKRYGIVAKRGGNLEAIRDAVAKLRSGEVTDFTELNYADLVNIEELSIDDVEPLRAELDAFVSAVTGETEPEVTVADGLAAVETAERIVEAIEPHAL